jgi:uncharacterized membrane protein (DUF485 family)
MPTLTQTILAFASRSCDRRRGTLVVLGSLLAALVIVLVSYWLTNARVNFCAVLSSSRPAVMSWWGCPCDASLAVTLGLADLIAGFLLALGHLVVIPVMVSASLSGERRNRTFDQLRTTPTSARALFAGFIVGVPAIAYLALTGLWALRVLAMLVGALPITTFIESSAALFAGGLAVSVVAAADALVKERATPLAPLAVGGLSLVSVFVVIAAWIQPAAPWRFIHPLSAALSSYHRSDAYWVLRIFSHNSGFSQPANPAHVFNPLLCVLLCVAVVWLVAAPACRRLRAPTAALLSAPRALALFALLAGAALLPAPKTPLFGMVFVSSIVLFPLMALLLLLSQPSKQAWLFALRRRSVAVPWLLTIGMLVVFYALVLIKGGQAPELPYRVRPGVTVICFVWTAWAGLWLGLYVHFAKARYERPLGRGVFLVMIALQHVFQLSAMVNYLDRPRYASESALDLLHVYAGFALALLMPMIIGWRLRALRRRALSQATAR